MINPGLTPRAGYVQWFAALCERTEFLVMMADLEAISHGRDHAEYDYKNRVRQEKKTAPNKELAWLSKNRT